MYYYYAVAAQQSQWRIGIESDLLKSLCLAPRPSWLPDFNILALVFSSFFLGWLLA